MSSAAPATSARSTSFPRAAGRLADTHGCFEVAPERAHHPRGRPQENEQADEAGRARGRRDRLDRVLDVLPPRRVDGKRFDHPSTTRSRTSSSWRTRPNAETSTIASGASERGRDRRCRPRAACSRPRRTSRRRRRRRRSAQPVDSDAAPCARRPASARPAVLRSRGSASSSPRTPLRS